MSEQQPHTAAAPEESSILETGAPLRPGEPAAPGRTGLVWLLAVLSLLPGVVAATAREFWTGLPDPFRWTSYALAGLFMVVAVGLIMTRKE
jgi:hypothetical protein